MLQVAHVFVDRGALGTAVMLVDELVGALQRQFPLLAVLGLIDVDELAEESALTTVLGNELGALLIGILETEAVALIIAYEALVAPCRNLVHRHDARLVECQTGVLLYLVVVFLAQVYLAES